MTVVPRENPLALAKAIVQMLDGKRRTRPHTTELIEREYRPAAVQAQYRTIYQRVMSAQNDVETGALK